MSALFGKPKRLLTSFPEWSKILGSSVELQIFCRIVVLPAFARPMMSMRKGPNMRLIRSSSGGSSGLTMEEDGCG